MFLNKEVETDTHIHGFFGKYRFLSNFHLCPVFVWNDGLTYPSSENAYMAQKTSSKLVKEIFAMNCVTPKHARNLGQQIIVEDDWDVLRVGIMYFCVKLKFLQNPDISELLLATGDKILEETNGWNDTFWGVCNGVGENNLGKILMSVREEIIKGI
jgi:hypothetical protein